ncbi:hypothetical protein BB561_001408 [Smittium simulii]|uniref:Nucleoside diphosphate kinase n=1 Tax=Smittium simulii TaxID=133385 RepID=A0A2T9YUR5_9FUNG|nr:hypothetical protein BB561_001408 [Smittium simulii]
MLTTRLLKSPQLSLKSCAIKSAVSKLVLPTNTEYTLALLKPDLCADPHAVQQVISDIQKLSSTQNNIYLRKELVWNIEQAQQFYYQHKDRFFYTRLTTYMTSGSFEALILTGENIISQWRGLIGTTQPVRAKVSVQDSLRAKYGITDTRNSFHGSDSKESALKEISFVFGNL